MRTTGVPGWLVFVGSTGVAMVFAIGLVALLVLGKTVPDQLWILAGVIATAYFGSGPFSLMSQHQADAAAHQATTTTQVIDLGNHAIAALRESASDSTAVRGPIAPIGTAGSA